MDYYLKQKGPNYWETQNHGWTSKTLFWAKESKHRRHILHYFIYIKSPNRKNLSKLQEPVVPSGELERIVMRPQGSFWVNENVLYHVSDSDYIDIFNCQIPLMCAL